MNGPTATADRTPAHRGTRPTGPPASGRPALRGTRPHPDMDTHTNPAAAEATS